MTEGCFAGSRIVQTMLCLLNVIMLMVFASQLQAAGNIENSLSASEDYSVIRSEYFTDSTAEMDLQQVLSKEHSPRWQVVLEDVANFGYQSQPYWYRFDIANNQNQALNQIIEIAYPLLDRVDFYRLDQESELIQHATMGDRVAYSERIYDHSNFLFPLELAAHETASIYLRVETTGSQMVPLKLWNRVPLFSKHIHEAEIHAAYFGMVLVIVLLNIMIYLGLREKVFIYYAINSLLFMLLFAALRGKLYPIVFSSEPVLHHQLLLLLPPLCLLSAALFSREFLSIPRYSKALNFGINLIVLWSLVCVLGVFLLDNQSSLKLSVVSSIPASFCLLVLGPVLSWKGNKIAWVYTLAWGMLMGGATLAALSKQGTIPVNFVTEYGMQIGSALEIFILNMALAYRIYRVNRERIAAQEISLQDSAERLDAEQKLLEVSMLHPVTMMPNRICLERQISESIKNTQQELVVCTIENRRYAEVCKTLGLQNADLMLCELAKQYNQYLAEIPGVLTIHGPSIEARMCSLDGGAFGYLLDAKVVREHKHVVNAVLGKMAQPILFKDMRLEMCPVIGAAYYPKDGLNSATLLRHAQVAAGYADPSTARVSVYRPEQDQYDARRLMLVSDLKAAIKADQLMLYFQPKYCLQSERVTGLEALLRWQHERYGVIRPDEFIPIAEQTGVIKMLTRWVVNRALENHRHLKREGISLTMALNISALNLNEPDLLDFLRECIKNYQITPGDIFLELTETSMMLKPEEAIETLRKIRDLGFKIAIDDFGSGYSSLGYMNNLPVDEIKIDRSLVASLGDNARSESVLKATITMCHELGFLALAEGVESEVAVQELKALSCDLIQGYVLTPALPLPSLLQWLEQQRSSAV